MGQYTQAQGLSESIKKKFTVGADVYTDIWQGLPDGVESRTINQGATAFGMFNFQLGESITSFSIGLGIRNHNLYTNSKIDDFRGDTIVLTPIPDDVDYKRSKINLVYLDVPAEFKIRMENGFKVTVGFKVGWLIDSKEKYVGDIYGTTKGVKEKSKKIWHTESISYGPTFRVGYKFISLYGYYQISDAFKRNLGPEVAPISIGLTITPF